MAQVGGSSRRQPRSPHPALSRRQENRRCGSRWWAAAAGRASWIGYCALIACDRRRLRRPSTAVARDSHADSSAPGTGGADRLAFYEESPRVKSPVAVLHLRWAGHFLSYKRFLRWLARFDCECERISLVTTFYPCRRGWPNTRCCIRPKRARRTGFGRSAPSIRTAGPIARPRQITGASATP